MKKDRYNEEDFNSFIEQLIESGRIEDHGYEALSAKQKHVFDHMIANNTVDECKRCAIDIPWCEMLEALDNGGYCNYCQHMMEKIEAE